MATVKKKIDLDTQLVDKVQILLGDDISFTYLVSQLMWSLVYELEHKKFSLPDTIRQSARQTIDEISQSPPLRAEEL
jgi:hypothetical protein